MRKSKKQRQSDALSRWQDRRTYLNAQITKVITLPEKDLTPEIAEKALYLQGRLEVAKREIANLEAKGVRLS